MSYNHASKSTASTGSNTTTDDNKEEMIRNNSAVSTVDVKVGIPSESAQSMITQVDRNGQTVKHSTSSSHPNSSANNQNVNNKTISSSSASVRPRSFLERIFCCGPKPSAAAPPSGGQIGLVVASNSGKSLERKNSPNSSSLRSLPARLPEMESTARQNKGKKCLALDLDETLVHSSFQPVENASFVISVVIEGIVHNVYVMKRPGCDEFMKRLAEHYELLIYTASLSKYADPLLDILDPTNLISKRLFREHCVFYDGHYVKDLSLLNRDISQTIIVDNSPMSYIFHPENAIDCSSFFDDPKDVELWQIADFLISVKSCEDVRPFCRHWREWCRNNPTSVPSHMQQHRKHHN